MSGKNPESDPIPNHPPETSQAHAPQESLGNSADIDPVKALKATALELWTASQRLNKEEEALWEKLGPSVASVFAEKRVKLFRLLLRALVQLRKSDELKWKQEITAAKQKS